MRPVGPSGDRAADMRSHFPASQQQQPLLRHKGGSEYDTSSGTSSVQPLQPVLQQSSAPAQQQSLQHHNSRASKAHHDITPAARIVSQNAQHQSTHPPRPMLQPAGLRPPLSQSSLARPAVPLPMPSLSQPRGSLLHRPLQTPLPPPQQQQQQQLSQFPAAGDGRSSGRASSGVRLGLQPRAAAQLPPPSLSLQQRPQFSAMMSHDAGQPALPPPPLSPPSSLASGKAPPAFGQHALGRSNQSSSPMHSATGSKPQPGFDNRQPGRGVIPGDSDSGPPASRIDPRQLPRPHSEGVPKEFETRVDGKHRRPPPTDRVIAVRDRGNASPRNIRLSLNKCPSNSSIRKLTGLPFAAAIQPLAVPGPEDDDIPVVESEEGPVRCSNCKAYMNGFMTFVESGRRFQCNLCGHSCDTPHHYICALGPNGRRLDTQQRPELCRGSVDYVATKEYMVQPPMPPTHMFLIDVSVMAMESGATAAICHAVSQVLPDIQGGDRARLAIATFDSTVHFYALRPQQSAPQMIVMPDVADPYSPAAAMLVVPAIESRSLALQLLASIPKLFEGTCLSEAATGAAISAAVSVLEGTPGGKLHVFMGALPRVGLGSLEARSPHGVAAVEEPLAVMAPQGKFFTDLGKHAADNQIAVDVFVMGSAAPCEVATVREVAAHTGGDLYHYSAWDSVLDSNLLFNDLRWNIMRPQVLEGVARLRVSRGLHVQSYQGAYRSRTVDDVDLPAINADQTIVATLEHNSKLTDDTEAFLQFALLHTTTSGERRIRVFNLGIPVSNVVGMVYSGADLETVLNVTAREAAAKLPVTSLPDTRARIQKQLVRALTQYRINVARDVRPGQLILPDRLRVMPLYTMCLDKLPCFRTDIPHDARAAWMAQLLTLPVSRTMGLLLGRMLSIHSLLAAAAATPSDSQPGLTLPLPMHGLNLSSKEIDPGGVYLWENGQEAILYIGQHAPVQMVHALLGEQPPTPALQQPGCPPRALPTLDNFESRTLHTILDSIRQQRSSFMRLRVVMGGDPGEAGFLSRLVEDRIGGSLSYEMYLCSVYKTVNAQIFE